MKKIPISLLCGFAAIVVTVLLYIILLPNIFLRGMCLLTLGGVIVAEIVVTAFAYFSNGDPRKVASAVVSAFLIPYAVVLSFVYIIHFPCGYGTYMAWYFAGLLVVSVLAVILSSFSGRKEEENATLQNAKQHMMALRNLVKCIMANPSSAPYHKELVAIEEKLHFTNDSVISPQDAVIESLLTEILRDISNPEADISAMLTNVNQVIDTRTIMTKYSV